MPQQATSMAASPSGASVLQACFHIFHRFMVQNQRHPPQPIKHLINRLQKAATTRRRTMLPVARPTQHPHS